MVSKGNRKVLGGAKGYGRKQNGIRWERKGMEGNRTVLGGSKAVLKRKKELGGW